MWWCDICRLLFFFKLITYTCRIQLSRAIWIIFKLCTFGRNSYDFFYRIIHDVYQYFLNYGIIYHFSSRYYTYIGILYWIFVWFNSFRTIIINLFYYIMAFWFFYDYLQWNGYVIIFMNNDQWFIDFLLCYEVHFIFVYLYFYR